MPRGPTTETLLGPHWAKQNMHRIAALATAAQHTSQAFPSGVAPALPPLFPRVEQQQIDRALSDDLLFTLPLWAGQVLGVILEKVRHWRRSQIRELKRLVTQGEDGFAPVLRRETLKSGCSAGCSGTSWNVLAGVDFPLLMSAASTHAHGRCLRSTSCSRRPPCSSMGLKAVNLRLHKTSRRKEKGRWPKSTAASWNHP